METSTIPPPSASNSRWLKAQEYMEREIQLDGEFGLFFLKEAKRIWFSYYPGAVPLGPSQHKCNQYCVQLQVELSIYTPRPFTKDGIFGAHVCLRDVRSGVVMCPDIRFSHPKNDIVVHFTSMFMCYETGRLHCCMEYCNQAMSHGNFSDYGFICPISALELGRSFVDNPYWKAKDHGTKSESTHEKDWNTTTDKADDLDPTISSVSDHSQVMSNILGKEESNSGSIVVYSSQPSSQPLHSSGSMTDSLGLTFSISKVKSKTSSSSTTIPTLSQSIGSPIDGKQLSISSSPITKRHQRLVYQKRQHEKYGETGVRRVKGMSLKREAIFNISKDNESWFNYLLTSRSFGAINDILNGLISDGDFVILKGTNTQIQRFAMATVSMLICHERIDGEIEMFHRDQQIYLDRCKANMEKIGLNIDGTTTATDYPTNSSSLWSLVTRSPTLGSISIPTVNLPPINTEHSKKAELISRSSFRDKERLIKTWVSCIIHIWWVILTGTSLGKMYPECFPLQSFCFAALKCMASGISFLNNSVNSVCTIISADNTILDYLPIEQDPAFYCSRDVQCVYENIKTALIRSVQNGEMDDSFIERDSLQIHMDPQTGLPQLESFDFANRFHSVVGGLGYTSGSAGTLYLRCHPRPLPDEPKMKFKGVMELLGSSNTNSQHGLKLLTSSSHGGSPSSSGNNMLLIGSM